MNIKTILSIGVALALLTPAFTSASSKPRTLTILMSNFRNEKGLATVELFRRGDAIPKKPFLRLSAKIENGKAVAVFEDIPYGEYAAIFFHDENSNGVLDHRWGFPNEPMGFSNDWTLTLTSGMPSFSKLKFQFTKEKPDLSLRITGRE